MTTRSLFHRFGVSSAMKVFKTMLGIPTRSVVFLCREAGVFVEWSFNRNNKNMTPFSGIGIQGSLQCIRFICLDMLGLISSTYSSWHTRMHNFSLGLHGGRNKSFHEDVNDVICLEQILGSSDCHISYHRYLERKFSKRLHLPFSKFASTGKWQIRFALIGVI